VSSAPGTFGTATGATAVTTCSGTCQASAGSFCGFGASSPSGDICTYGMYSVAGATACSLCPPGRFGGLQQLQSSLCSGLCRPGRYSEGGVKRCADCPVGTWSSVEGATSLSACIPCTTRPGSYCGVGMVASGGVPCPPGRAAAGMNATECGVCDRGWYAPSPGLSVCLPCPLGQFSAQPAGATECTVCAPGTFANIPASVACSGPCVALPGHGCLSGSGNATGSPCPAGRYSMGGAGAECVNCPSGR
jgi:hypothetical protein